MFMTQACLLWNKMVRLTNLKKEDFKSILENYEIGEYKSDKHIWQALENTVYELRTTNGKYIVKISEKSKPSFLRYQIKIINFLKEKGLPVQEYIKTKSGKYIFFYKHKNILINKFIEGKIDVKLDKDLVIDIAHKLGLLNKYLLKIKLTGKYTWGKDYQFKPLRERAGIIGKFNFTKEEKKLLKDMKKLKRNKLRKSLIHGDFHPSNFVIKNNKLVGIMDWDDMREDFLVCEVSLFIVHSLASKNLDEEKIKLFLKEYQKIVKLNNEEKKASYYLMKNNCLMTIAWCEIQQRTHKDNSKKIQRWETNIIKEYFDISRMSLESFLEFF